MVIRTTGPVRANKLRHFTSPDIPMNTKLIKIKFSFPRHCFDNY